MTPFHPFETGQVDDFRDLSAMQVLVDDRIAILDVLDDFPVGFPAEIAQGGAHCRQSPLHRPPRPHALPRLLLVGCTPSHFSFLYVCSLSLSPIVFSLSFTLDHYHSASFLSSLHHLLPITFSLSYPTSFT